MGSDHGRNVGNTATSFDPLIGIRPTADPLNWYSKRISSLPMAEPSVSVGRPEEKEINHRKYGDARKALSLPADSPAKLVQDWTGWLSDPFPSLSTDLAAISPHS